MENTSLVLLWYVMIGDWIASCPLAHAVAVRHNRRDTCPRYRRRRLTIDRYFTPLYWRIRGNIYAHPLPDDLQRLFKPP